ncbi:MAG: PAS domain S-box protein [Deltaproteobacteria bacterium]|nr:PAS domain S-box protein [Deltaproteobacteria bacterium]
MKVGVSIAARYSVLLVSLVLVASIGIYVFGRSPVSAVLLTISILFMAIALTVFVTGRFSGAIRRLVFDIEEMADGRLDRSIEVPIGIGLSGLARAVNLIRERQRGYRQRVEEHTERLQKRIEELEKANARLSADLDTSATGEDEHARGEERLKSLLEYSSDVTSTMDNVGRIQYVGPAVTRVLGYRADEIIGKKMFDFVHPDDLHAATTAYVAAFQSPGRPSAIQFRFRHRDGSWRHMEAIVNNLLLVPAVGAVIVNYRDFTERIRLEEQLIQTQKMETIGRLAGGVAHDFNNLLLVITEYSRFVKQSLKQGDRALGDIEQVLAAAERAAGLTRQLLAFSRRQVIEPRMVKIPELIANMEKMLRRLIGEDVALVVRHAGDLPPVRVDPGQIEQVIMNLVVNARDAMPRGGAVTIETARAALDDSEGTRLPDVATGEFVRVSIADTGTGMTEEVKAHLFEPFFTTKALGKGTGLGLATVYGIVKQHQGNIIVESEPGKGAVFKVYLPALLDVRKAEPEAADAPPVPRGTETVLVVEDEPMVRGLTGRMLRDLGYTVIEAEDGPEALAVAEKYSSDIHLLLTDVIMPEMDGGEVADRFARVRRGAKVMFMSGYTDDVIADHGVLEPGKVLIKKPFGPDLIGRKVREVLDGPPYESQPPVEST